MIRALMVRGYAERAVPKCWLYLSFLLEQQETESVLVSSHAPLHTHLQCKVIGGTFGCGCLGTAQLPRRVSFVRELADADLGAKANSTLMEECEEL